MNRSFRGQITEDLHLPCYTHAHRSEHRSTDSISNQKSMRRQSLHAVSVSYSSPMQEVLPRQEQPVHFSSYKFHKKLHWRGGTWRKSNGNNTNLFFKYILPSFSNSWKGTLQKQVWKKPNYTELSSTLPKVIKKLKKKLSIQEKVGYGY